MTSEQDLDSRRPCVTCGTPVSARYCSSCGEKVLTDHDHSVWHLVAESLELFVHFDSKFLRTVRLLVTRPGFLTQEYWVGRRVRYMKPLQLLIVLNLLYFAASYASTELGFRTRVMFPTLGDILDDRVFSRWAMETVRARILSRGTSAAAYGASFDVELEHLAKSLVILLVPILAVFLRIFYWRTKSFLDQLIAATHLVGFYIVFWSVFMLLMGAATKAVSLFAPGEPVTALTRAVRYLPSLCLGGYIFVALKTMYGQGVLWTIVKAAIFLFAVIQAITNIYDFVLFCAAFVLV